MQPRVEFKLVRPNAKMPTYKHEKSAALELYAALDKSFTLSPKDPYPDKVPTGVVVSIPEGFEGQIRPDSSLAYNNGITVRTPSPPQHRQCG